MLLINLITISWVDQSFILDEESKYKLVYRFMLDFPIEKTKRYRAYIQDK